MTHAQYAGKRARESGHGKVSIGAMPQPVTKEQATFLIHGRQPEVGRFPFNLSSHYHVYIVKYPFLSRDDWSENLGETAVLACKMFTSLMLSGDICFGVPLNVALRIAKRLGLAELWNYPQP